MPPVRPRCHALGATTVYRVAARIRSDAPIPRRASTRRWRWARQPTRRAGCSRRGHARARPAGSARPDYAVRRQLRGHATVLFCALVVSCGIGALIVSHSPWIKPAALIASIAAGVAALFHLWYVLTNPNRGRTAQREQAQAAVAAGEIEVLKPGSTQTFRDPAQPSAGHVLAFLALVLAPLPFLAPVGMYSTLNLPDNPGLAPYVIGPGDVVRVPIPASGLSGIHGYWKASATAQLLNAKEVGGPLLLNASSRSKDWGNSIYADKPRGKANENQSLNVPINDLYADVYVPDVPALGGKTLRVKVTLNVAYPMDKGQQRSLGTYQYQAFADQSSTVSKEVVLHLAAGSGHRVYRAAWAYGAAFGGLLYFAGGVGLFLLTARPTSGRLSTRAGAGARAARHALVMRLQTLLRPAFERTLVSDASQKR